MEWSLRPGAGLVVRKMHRMSALQAAMLGGHVRIEQCGSAGSLRSSEHAARPVLPKPPVVLAKALKPRLVFRRKLGAVTENVFDHAKFIHMQHIYK